MTLVDSKASSLPAGKTVLFTPDGPCTAISGELWLDNTRVSALLAGQQPVAIVASVGELAGIPVRAVLLPAVAPGLTQSRLRDQLLALTMREGQLLSTASQLLEWDSAHRYCGYCGGATEVDGAERARLCRQCNHHWYPRISPCMITVVVKNERLLLARGTRSPTGLYSALAGFVEAGESVEDTVHREIMEEVGLRVRNLSYLGSQSWPFPHQLMIGFLAEYHSGDLMIDPEEIVDARWFTPDELPPVPPPQTLSGQLIAAAIAKIRAQY